MKEFSTFIWISIFAIIALIVNGLGILTIYNKRDWAVFILNSHLRKDVLPDILSRRILPTKKEELGVMTVLSPYPDS